jgi:hypothetical protein
MKLYFFKPDLYGDEYFIMSESRDEALSELKKYLLSEIDDDSDTWEGDDYFHRGIYEKWENATVDNLPEEYSLEIVDKNKVINTYYG